MIHPSWFRLLVTVIKYESQTSNNFLFLYHLLFSIDSLVSTRLYLPPHILLVWPLATTPNPIKWRLISIGLFCNKISLITILQKVIITVILWKILFHCIFFPPSFEKKKYRSRNRHMHNSQPPTSKVNPQAPTPDV